MRFSFFSQRWFSDVGFISLKSLLLYLPGIDHNSQEWVIVAPSKISARID